MQTDGFQLNAFQQDGGESVVFSLAPTAAVGLSGSLSVSGTLALDVGLSGSVALSGAIQPAGTLAQEIALAGSVALSGALSTTGDVRADVQFGLAPTAAVGLTGALSVIGDTLYADDSAILRLIFNINRRERERRKKVEPELPVVDEVVITKVGPTERPARTRITISDIAAKRDKAEADALMAKGRAQAAKRHRIQEEDALLLM